MAVPRRKHSHARQGKRRAQWKMKPVQLGECSHCGAAVRPHTICLNCGWYKGRQVLVVER